MANETEKLQNIILENREKLSVTGVIDILTFDEDEIMLETENGILGNIGKRTEGGTAFVRNGRGVGARYGGFHSIFGRNKAKKRIFQKYFQITGWHDVGCYLHPLRNFNRLFL